MVTVIAMASSWAALMFDDPDRLAPMHSMLPGARASVMRSIRLTLGYRVLMMLITERYFGRNCATVVDPLSTPQKTIRSGVLELVVHCDVMGDAHNELFVV